MLPLPEGWSFQVGATDVSTARTTRQYALPAPADATGPPAVASLTAFEARAVMRATLTPVGADGQHCAGIDVLGLGFATDRRSALEARAAAERAACADLVASLNRVLGVEPTSVARGPVKAETPPKPAAQLASDFKTVE